jgi:hypothetical protein
MSKTIEPIKIDPMKIRKGVRDERIKDMITTPGGVTRTFKDKKKAEKADKVKRKRKHKKQDDE